jgi:hypothetical protein
MISLPLHSEGLQGEENEYVIPILDGCKEHALEAVQQLVKHGKIKYRFMDGIFLSYFMPKFIGYLEIQELDNEARGISQHLGFQIYDSCMPTVPIRTEYSEANIINLGNTLLSPYFKGYKEKYIMINEDDIILYPVLNEQAREMTPDTMPDPTR